MGKFIILSGDDTFLIDEALKKAKQSCKHEELDALNPDVSLNTLYQNMATDSLFSGSRLVLLKDPWFLQKKLSKDEAQHLDQIIALAPKVDHHLIICRYGSLDQRLKHIKALLKQASHQTFKSFKDWEQAKVLAWLKQRLQAGGITSIHPDALLALEHTGGTNLQQLASECDKLLLYCGPNKKEISLADVAAICSGSAASIFHFNEAFQRADANKSMTLLYDLLSQGEDAVRLMGLLAANLRFYLQLIACHAEGQSAANMAKTLGKNSYFLQKVLPCVTQAYTLDRVKTLICYLAKLDAQVKGGEIAAKQALILVVAKGLV
eukprot:COSAG01_NODE_93_length_27013_cov_41.515791_5_plen_321_part_00